jgi:hypothetical protein
MRSSTVSEAGSIRSSAPFGRYDLLALEVEEQPVPGGDGWERCDALRECGQTEADIASNRAHAHAGNAEIERAEKQSG